MRYISFTSEKKIVTQIKHDLRSNGLQSNGDHLNIIKTLSKKTNNSEVSYPKNKI